MLAFFFPAPFPCQPTARLAITWSSSPSFLSHLVRAGTLSHARYINNYAKVMLPSHHHAPPPPLRKQTIPTSPPALRPSTIPFPVTYTLHDPHSRFTPSFPPSPFYLPCFFIQSFFRFPNPSLSFFLIYILLSTPGHWPPSHPPRLYHDPITHPTPP